MKKIRLKSSLNFENNDVFDNFISIVEILASFIYPDINYKFPSITKI